MDIRQVSPDEAFPGVSKPARVGALLATGTFDPDKQLRSRTRIRAAQAHGRVDIEFARRMP